MNTLERQSKQSLTLGQGLFLLIMALGVSVAVVAKYGHPSVHTSTAISEPLSQPFVSPDSPATEGSANSLIANVQPVANRSYDPFVEKSLTQIKRLMDLVGVTNKEAFEALGTYDLATNNLFLWNGDPYPGSSGLNMKIGSSWIKLDDSKRVASSKWEAIEGNFETHIHNQESLSSLAADVAIKELELKQDSISVQEIKDNPLVNRRTFYLVAINCQISAPWSLRLVGYAFVKPYREKVNYETNGKEVAGLSPEFSLKTVKVSRIYIGETFDGQDPASTSSLNGFRLTIPGSSG